MQFRETLLDRLASMIWDGLSVFLALVKKNRQFVRNFTSPVSAKTRKAFKVTHLLASPISSTLTGGILRSGGLSTSLNQSPSRFHRPSGLSFENNKWTELLVLSSSA